MKSSVLQAPRGGDFVKQAASAGQNMPRAWWLLAAGAFFLSGALGLAYEVIWFKRIAHVWGSASLSVAGVVTSFLLGLGIGAALVSRRIERVRNPLRVYGLIEVAIGVLALLIPFELQILQWTYGWLYAALSALPPAGAFLLRMGLIFIVLGPPTILMGATLPLLVKHFGAISTGRHVTGRLYGLNTLGAAVGCYLTGFHLLPAMGLGWTNVLCVLASIGIGLVMIAIARRTGDVTDEPDESLTESPERRAAGSRATMLLVAAALSGCAALILQIVWNRQLALVLGGSTYAFTGVLVMVLIGIAMGSLLFELVRKRWDEPLGIAAGVAVAIAVTVVAGKFMLIPLTDVVALLRPLRTGSSANALLCMTASGVVELLPSIGFGFLFPLFVHVGTRLGGGEARMAGTCYAFNTLGTLVGGAIGSILLLPILGTAGATAVATGLCVIIAGLMLLMGGRIRLGTLAGVVVLGAVSVVLAIQPLDPTRTDAGSYLYGYSEPEGRAPDVLFFREGANCNVLVMEADGARSLRVNGKVDAGTQPGDMPMQLGLAYVPLMLKPQAKDVCVIGHGSGTTSGAALAWGSSPKVTCCEIEPAVFEASPHFSAVNHQPEKQTRFTAIVDDGRSHLAGTSNQYDLILSEPSNPWMAGVGNLFTVEFYESAKKRLKPDGILAQWLQLYICSVEDYTMVVRTVRSVFPHCMIVRLSSGDTIILASAQPFPMGLANIETAQQMINDTPVVRDELESYFETSNVRRLLLERVCVYPEGIEPLAGSSGSKQLNTDLNHRLEYDAPRSLFKPMGDAPMHEALLKGVNPTAMLARAKEWNCGREYAAVFQSLCSKLMEEKQHARIADVARAGLQLDSHHPAMRASQIAADLPDQAEPITKQIDSLLQSNSNGLTVASYVGTLLRQQKRFAASAVVYQRILAKHPQSTNALTNLAANLREMGEVPRATEVIRIALNIDSTSGEVQEEARTLSKMHQAPRR